MDALDCFCTGNNWCYIASHGAGDLVTGDLLANYGGSARLKKNASANSAGQCGNTDGSSQTVPDPLTQDLMTTTARAMYNHNTTRGIRLYMYAGAKGTLYSGILPGQDDEAVAYHSPGGVAGSSGGAYCNPSDWFCNDPALGTAADEGGSAKSSYHSVSFRDDKEAYNHHTNGNSAGIVSVVRSEVVSSAQ